ncbi:DUF4912 domain-containing protein [Paenibacillus phyllosphaerae]|nr:DUF4912 domain-containing protein [Paenibacillus phyllosphaerae]
MTTIMALLEAGKTQKEVAEQLGIPIGKLRYQVTNFRKTRNAAPIQSAMEVDDYTLLDEQYGLDRLVVMPRDAESLYVYWELTTDLIKMVEAHFGCGWNVLPKKLRVYDVSFIHFKGDNFNRYWDFDVNQETSNWFVKGVAAGCSYVIDYGTTALDGRFITLLRSGAVQTPPLDEHAEGESRWVRMEVTKATEEAGPNWQPYFTGYSLSTQLDIET